MIENITAIYSIKVKENNLWVLDRIEWLTNYDPPPKFIIVDYGSSRSYSEIIRRKCEKIKAQYIYVNSEQEEFSLAKARNIGFTHVETDFVFFTDIDFVFEKNFFLKLYLLSQSLEISKYPLRFILIPAYFVSKKESEKFILSSFKDREKLIYEWSLWGGYTEVNTIFDFIAPYSNNIFCNSKFFNIIGGYCEDFIGYGCEDFEFVLRAALIINYWPIPKKVDDYKIYKPFINSFWSRKGYIGIRKLLELISLPFENFGLKAFHIWHEKPFKNYWTSEINKNRRIYKNKAKLYIKDSSKILNIDFLIRNKKSLVILDDKKKWRLFLPLRLLGYELSVVQIKYLKMIFTLFEEIQKYDNIVVLESYPKKILSKFKEINSKISTLNLISLEEFRNDKFPSKDNELTLVYDIRHDELCPEYLLTSNSIIPTGIGNEKYKFSWKSYINARLLMKKLKFIKFI